MKHRRVPSALGDVLGSLSKDLQPASLLADVQRVWPEVVGPALAAQATPTAARGGVVTVACASAVWAQELDLLSDELVRRLGDLLGAGVVTRLRCQVVPARSWTRK